MNFSVKIVGGGPLCKSLQNEIDRVGLTDQVKLVGPKSEKEVSELFLESEIMLLQELSHQMVIEMGFPMLYPRQCPLVVLFCHPLVQEPPRQL